MATTRDTLIDAMETRFAGITVAGGYRTGIGSSVRTWQAARPSWDDLPLLQVKDPVDAMEPPAYGVVRHDLTVQAEVLLPGEATAETLRDYAADVLQAVGVDPTWGTAAQETPVETVAATVEIEVGDAEDVAPGVTVTLTVRYESGLWEL